MARLADSGPSLLRNRDGELAEIRAWYEWKLARTVPPRGLEWEPVKLGPVWDWDPKTGWNLPEYTLGWDVLAWCGLWLNGAGGDPWVFTPEQARALLWFYAVEPSGGFVSHHYALQRLKGWGKDPLAATVAVASMVGPVVPEWRGDRLVGRDEPEAWVQILAVSLEQTKNTMKLFPSLIPQETRSFYGIQTGKRNLWALGDTRQVEAVTSSADSIEGGRPTLLIANEIQNWTASNGGHDMMGAIEGNAAKAKKDRPARQLSIFNAYVPGRDSVAQRVREGWESTQGDSATHREFGLLYDSLEAPPEAPLTAEAAPSVVRAVRGDAVWLDADDRILKSILNPANPPSESRRKWYNQVTADEDSWLSPQDIDGFIDRDKVLDPADEVVVFFDGSKTDDATAAVYCRVSDGHCGVVGMWQRPPMNRIGEWVVPRADVDATISEFVESHNVVALFADPSHALEDETMVLFWDTLLDEWHDRWKRRFRLWAKQGRDRGHSVLFDMSDSRNLRLFVTQVGVTTQEIMSPSGGEVFSWDGDVRLRAHLLNAKRVPSRFGMSLGKNNRKSQRKIDLAVCLVGARMVRREYMLRGKKRRGGRVG
nr:MAG TPA: Large Terminase [Caudoviricetes sp.]